MKTADAVKKIQQKLRRDRGFYNTYHSNIAACIKDATSEYIKKTGKKHLGVSDMNKISEEAAHKFLNLFCS